MSITNVDLCYAGVSYTFVLLLTFMLRVGICIVLPGTLFMYYPQFLFGWVRFLPFPTYHVVEIITANE